MRTTSSTSLRGEKIGNRTAARIAALGKLARTLKYRVEHRDINNGVGRVDRGKLEYGIVLGRNGCGDLLLLTLDGLLERETNWYGDEDFRVSERRYPDVVRCYRHGLTIRKLAALRRQLRAA